MKQAIYDSHCHLFYRGYITRRILNALLELTTDLNKLVSYNKIKNFKHYKQKIKVHSIIRRTINVINLTLSDSSEQVLLKLQNHYKGLEVVFVPLSYDVTSCFQESYNEDITDIAAHKENDIFSSVKDNMLLLLDRYVGRLAQMKIFSQLQILYEKLEELTASKTHDNEEQNKSLDHFAFLIDQLLELKQKYPDKIFPFLYVDPRREQTLSQVRQMVGQGKPFLGIKLYAPNGYSPLDPSLMDMYDYCESNNIPVTVHNSFGGFSSFVKKLEIKGAFFEADKVIEHNGWIEFKTDFFSNPRAAILERAEKLNHPNLWHKVLSTFPNLKLNLAHFGGDGKHWQELIIKLLMHYPNAYADLSCQTEKTMLEHIRKNYFSLAPNKFLYGSDYYLNMLFIDTFAQYMSNFFSTFSESELDAIMYYNARSFLFHKQEAYTS